MTDLPALLVIVCVRQDTLQGLHRQSASFLYRDTQVPYREHSLPAARVESKFYLGLHLLLVGHLGIVDECSPTSVRRLVSGRGILKALDNGGLAAAVVSNDHGYWGKELDDGNLFVVKRPDAANREFVQRSHRWSGQCSEGGDAVERLMKSDHVRARHLQPQTRRSVEPEYPALSYHGRHRYPRYAQAC